MKKLTLYSNPICPFVHRALIAMVEKGAKATVDTVHVDLGNMPDWYAKINPRETVPTLVIEGEPTVYESAFIAEYFDRHFGTPNVLFPSIAATRAQIRAFQATAGDMIGDVYGVLFAGDNEIGEAVQRAKEAVRKVESVLVERQRVTGGPFFLGPQLSLADIHVVPFLLRFSAVLPALKGVDVFADAPALQRLLEVARVRPSVASTALEAAAYVEAYKGYGASGGKPRNVDLTPVVRGHFASPFAQRILVAAALAGLEARFEDATADDDERLPVLRATGVTVHDSMEVMLYLLEAARKDDNVPLFPASDAAFGRAQFVAQEADSLGSAVVQAAKNGDDAAWKEVMGAVQDLEAFVVGPFAAGPEVSFADAVLLPHLLRLTALKPDSLKEAPKLTRIANDVKKMLKQDTLERYTDDGSFRAFVAKL